MSLLPPDSDSTRNWVQFCKHSHRWNKGLLGLHFSNTCWSVCLLTQIFSGIFLLCWHICARLWGMNVARNSAMRMHLPRGLNKARSSRMSPDFFSSVRNCPRPLPFLSGSEACKVANFRRTGASKVSNT